MFCREIEMKTLVALGSFLLISSLFVSVPASAYTIDPNDLGFTDVEMQELQAELVAMNSEDNKTGSAVQVSITGDALVDSVFAESAPVMKNKVGITLPTQNIERFYKGGQFLKQAFEAEGYDVDLFYAGDNNVEIQQRQIIRMANEGCKVIIVGAVDCYALGEQLEKAKKAGSTIVAYGSMLMDTDAVDYLVSFDERRVGEIQGNYLCSALHLDQATPQNPKYIEVFSGVTSDSSSRAQFDGAMSVLRPYLASGALIVRSGVTDFDAASVGVSDENAIKRMDSLIADLEYGPQSNIKLDGILSPNDIASAGIITALERVGYDTTNMPKITGQDCSAMGVRHIEEGLQGMSVFKDGRILANSALKMTASILEGETVRITEPGFDNGRRQVPAYQCEPVQVAEGQYADIMIKNGLLTRNEIDNVF